MNAEIKESRPAQPQLFEVEILSAESSEAFLFPLSLSVYWSSGLSKGIEIEVTISQQGGISAESLRRSSRESPGKTFPLGFLTASSLTAEVAMSSFGEIVLTPEEEVVTDALRIIDPSIERLAPGGLLRVTSPGGRSPTHGGIFMRLKDVKDRVPIGSMGDGIWRMLGLALFVVRCRNGILLVDEIDTGLHYSVLEDMWKFLDSAARRYNVQVFATTHSRDCYESLAAIAHGSVSDNSDVTIQRIERGRERAVAYTEQMITAAAKHEIEVR